MELDLEHLICYFRGRNFVIKYEGSFKNENTDYVVLEHVEHDRPEVISTVFNFSASDILSTIIFSIT